MTFESTSILPSPACEGNPQPEPFYGLLAFARDLDAERRRLDRQALQAALETLAEEGR
jgi:hypothetical protein